MKLIQKLKSNLLVKIILAIATGIGCGYFMPDALARIFVTFNGIFSQMLGFLIPLIIIGFVAPAIADIGKGAGRILAVTAALAYIATIGSGFLSYFVADSVFPDLIISGSVQPVDAAKDLQPYLNIEIPPLMSVMTALVMAFMLGIGIAALNSKTLRSMTAEFRDIISKTISKILIPLLPVYIFGIFLNMTIAGQTAAVLGSFMKVILVIFALHVCLLLLQFCIASAVVRKNPFRLLATMMPAYFTALGTQSSAATIPVTLRQTIQMGVRKEIAGFVVPLCSTIHMSGSIMKIVCCSIAMMLMQGMQYDFAMFTGFICMIGISIIAAPGVPGGAIMASLGIMASMLGFSVTDQALIIALYIAMDSFGTACNVTGDGFIALIINKIFGRHNGFPTDIDMDEDDQQREAA